MNDTWNEWGKHVLKELERLNSCYADVKKELVECKTEIATLRVKASIWGAVAGSIPAIATVLIILFLK